MDFVALAQECAPWVAHQTMAAIVKTESAFRPLAIGVNGGAKLARQPETTEEAVVTAKWLISNGYNIDMGLGQLNSANLPRLGLSVEDAFEPCKNIAASATILHGSYKAARSKVQGEQAALHAALSAYNTGSFSRGFSNGYVQKVVNNAGFPVPGTPIDAFKPIPLLAAKTSKPAPPKTRTSEQAVKLTIEGASKPVEQSAGVSVYGPDKQNVMVFQ